MRMIFTTSRLHGAWLRRFTMVVLAIWSLCLAGTSAQAADTYWKGGTANWSASPTNWNPTEPNLDYDAYISSGTAQITAGNAEYADDVYLSSSGAVEVYGGSLTTDYSVQLSGSSAMTLYGGTVNVGSRAQLTGSSALKIYGGTMNVDTDLRLSSLNALEIQSGALNMNTAGSEQSLGYDNNSVGTIVQTGGSNSLGYNMYLGRGTNSQGYYTMSGSGATLSVQDIIYVGHTGTGVFQQSAGTVTISSSGHLEVGYNSGSNGTYRLSGGTLNVYGASGIQVGTDDGIGRFEWFHSGGINAPKMDMGSNGTLAMGYDFNSVPSIVNNLQLATLEVTNGATVTKNDGAVSQVYYLRIGSSTGAGHAVMSSGTVQVGQAMYVGDGGAGDATQDGGTFTIGTHLYLGTNSAQGTYRLRGGSLSVTNVFGGNGTSTLVLDGGTFNHNGTLLGYKTESTDWRLTNLKLGDESGRTGSYTLVAGKQVNVIDQYLGVAGTGNFTQSGGTANLVNLRLGTQTTGVGNYVLSGGDLNVSGQVLNGDGAGTLQIDGGTFNPSGSVNVDNLKLGITAACNHTQAIYGYTVGTLTIGNGTYRLASGTLRADGVANAAGAGTLNLDGGMFLPSGNINVDNLGIGIASANSHSQTGLTYTVGTLTLGSGSYTLSDGTLAVSGNVANGSGTGTLALNGGTFNLSGGLSVDNLHVGVNATAGHTLSSGTWQAGTMALGVQAGGNGTFTLAGGTLNVDGNISVGSGSGAFVYNGGTLGLGGNLSVTNLKVGQNAAASYTQSSKTFSASNDVVVGSGTGNGAYRLEQSGTLQVGNKVYVGASGGTGRFEWYRSGGLTVANGFDLGAAGTLAVGYDCDADQIAAMTTGLGGATLEITRGATAIQDADTVAAKTLRVGAADGGATYRLQDSGELTISTGGRLAIGAASQAGRFEWYRSGGLSAPLVAMESTGTLAMGADFDVAQLLDGSLFGGSLSGIGSATLEVTRDATASQAGGSVKLGQLVLGSNGLSGTYQLDGDSLAVGNLTIGSGGPGELDIVNSSAAVTVSGTVLLGREARVTAAPGSQITLTGSNVWNYSENPDKLAGLENLTLAFRPTGMIGILDQMELAGLDQGATMEGFVDNFTLGTLIVDTKDESHMMLRLVDMFRNLGPEPEALYVHNLYVREGATLDMNFLNVYYDGTFVQEGSIINGTPQFVPEPGSLILLATAAVGLLLVRKRTEPRS